MIQTFEVLPKIEMKMKLKIEKDDSCGITWPPDIYKSGIFISFQNRSVFAAIK